MLVKQINKKVYNIFFLLLKLLSLEEIMLKGMLIITFFSIFTIVSILIPIPLFPGSWLLLWIGDGMLFFQTLLSSLFNGLVYGSILGIVFHAISQKLEQ